MTRASARSSSSRGREALLRRERCVCTCAAEKDSSNCSVFLSHFFLTKGGPQGDRKETQSKKLGLVVAA